MNELKSYTEYAVSTPTADFVIGFDFNYGEDAVNVTVDDVPATTAGYTVVYLNETTIRLSPSVPSGVVRLQRETDIDQTDHAYRAGAKFIAQTMDENFEQLRHSQQEVRDGFVKLADDTYEIIDTLNEVGQSAQDAADAAEVAAELANNAAAQVNDKVSYEDFNNKPHNAMLARDAASAHPTSSILDTSGETQQQVNYNGGSKWHSRVGGYKENERVVLANGDIVKSTVDGNTNNPNVDMTGWVGATDAAFVVDGDKNQKQINDLNKDSNYLFKPSSALDHTTELQAAIDYCAANFLNCKPIGLFKISGKVVIKGEFDGSRCRIQTTTAIPIAVEVSTGAGENPTTVLSLAESESIILPDIVNGTKPSTGWVGQGIGVRYVNVQNTLITERLIQDFAIGVQHTAYSAGCGYNTVHAGYLRNNKVNRQFIVGDLTGWCNRWDLFGGRYFHGSVEGTTPIEGVIHFDVVPNAAGSIINDINHFGGSLEGLNEQYHIRLGGAHINFWGCRFETPAGSGGIKVHLAAAGIAGQGASNGIHYGRGVNPNTMTLTKDPIINVAQMIVNSTLTTSKRVVAGVVEVLQSTSSSSSPSLTILQAAAAFDVDPALKYSLSLAANHIGGKRQDDEFDRIRFDTQNGRLYFGDGVTAPTKYLQSRSDGIGSVGSFYPYQTEMYDLGNNTVKWRSMYAVKYMFTATVGAFHGSGSPEGVVSAGIGSTYHRTDGTAGQCFYVKETGTGNTGWIAK